MGYPDPTQRTRNQYGSVRAAVLWCAEELKLGVNATARQLGVDKRVVWRWRDQFGIQFPERIDMHPSCKGFNPNIAERNRLFPARKKRRS